MDLDFGYDPSKTGNNTGEGNENGNGGTSTDITTGKVNTDTNGAVSYTHLDVYKRQVLY